MKQGKRIGRPPLPEKFRRVWIGRYRLTQDEREDAQRLAAKEGYNMSEWVRALMLSAVRIGRGVRPKW